MKHQKILIFSLIALIAMSITACSKQEMLDGNHHLISETRQLVPFTRVVNEGSFNVIIVAGDETKAIVEAESNLIPLIRTIVNGNTLIIDSRESLQPNLPINIYLTTPEVNAIKLSGSGTIAVDTLVGDYVEVSLSGSGNIDANVSGSMLNVNLSGTGDLWLNIEAQMTFAKISGSGNMNLAGASNEGDFNISGSGKIYSYEFIQNKLNANISGSGNMFVNVMDFLKVKISGSGSVYYQGEPEVDINITGSGSVINQ
jgi:hypothetical protein